MDGTLNLFDSLDAPAATAPVKRKAGGRYSNPWADRSPLPEAARLPGMEEDLSGLTDAQIEEFWGRFIDDLLMGLRYAHSPDYAAAVCDFLESPTGAALVYMTHGVRGGDFADLLRSHLAAQKRRQARH